MSEPIVKLNFKPVFSSAKNDLQWFTRDITHNLLKDVMPFLQLMEEWQGSLIKDFKKEVEDISDTLEETATTEMTKAQQVKKMTADFKKLFENLTFLQTQSSLLTFEELDEQFNIIVKILSIIIDCDKPSYVEKAPEDYKIISDTRDFVLGLAKENDIKNNDFNEDMLKFWGEQKRENLLGMFNLFLGKANISKIKR